MSFVQWAAVLGTLLLILALASAYLRWLPVTTSVVCLAFGVAIGPLGLGLWHESFQDVAHWMEHLTEVAVLVSLFVSGLKLRLPLKAQAWRSAYWLAGPIMVLCITGTCLVCHYLLGLDWGISLLIGAILAPTDPVLASLVQVAHARDFDRVRYALSGEAGLNDGMAFPFVVLGLLLVHHGTLQPDWLGEWALHRLVWAVPAGLLIGYYLGKSIGRLAIYLQVKHRDSTISPNDFLALALIAIAYVLADTVGAWGFLSVFAAGLGLRRAEVSSSGHAEIPAEEQAQPTLGHITGSIVQANRLDNEKKASPTLAAGVLMGDMISFGNLLERSLEVLLVTLLGVLLYSHWDWRALIIGFALFCLIRPLSVRLVLSRNQVSPAQRTLIGWFGIRGIGSLYYLSYALNHGLTEGDMQHSVDLTLSVITLSILIHGVTTQPLLDRYERKRLEEGMQEKP
ncbi:NhaP-type Na+/H+ or K+/H+ antiporter [Pseudomonas duriflava]|uniref:NhaP-type Na+/H+ or K+/H+ antiporter n=1 Tax=Pseudomonas duriflava TaxID=459528 RepID=A0A562QG55_9PSED|nr:sodium:proton antiporter [Pseudomonas duriflava]TWI55016.1 NhaP-type Na+/H+ or K+/H+ antiporter [Pseudomonas duriflava]